MDDEIYVSCHAPSLSLLLFETARSIHDQKGLLVGQVCNEVISRKTDENEVNCERKTAIYLEHCIPIDQDTIGNTGIINLEKLEKYADISQNKIVGWYSFRRNCRLVPSSLSETLIHKSLLKLLPNVKCQYFVACFMSSNVASNMSTHTFNHVFTTYNSVRAKFEPLRLKIYTLSDKSVNSNGYSVKNPFPMSSNFNKIINRVQREETPVKSVLAIHERVSEVLKLIDAKLQSTETHRLELEQEVEGLKRRLETVNKKEIIVQEPEKKEITLKSIHFDPNIKYSAERRTSPLESVAVKILEMTDDDNNKKETRKHRPVASNSQPNTISEQRRPPYIGDHNSASLSLQRNKLINNSTADDTNSENSRDADSCYPPKGHAYTCMEY